MWRLRLIGFFILLLVLTTVATAEDLEETTPATGRPVAVVETTSYTFPSVLEGTEARHDFVVRNTGDAPLIIHEVKAA